MTDWVCASETRCFGDMKCRQSCVHHAHTPRKCLVNDLPCVWVRAPETKESPSDSPAEPAQKPQERNCYAACNDQHGGWCCAAKVCELRKER